MRCLMSSLGWNTVPYLNVLPVPCKHPGSVFSRLAVFLQRSQDIRRDSKKRAAFLNNSLKQWPTADVMKKLDIGLNAYSFAHLTLVLLLHYLVKYKVVVCLLATIMGCLHDRANVEQAQAGLLEPRPVDLESTLSQM